MSLLEQLIRQIQQNPGIPVDRSTNSYWQSPPAEFYNAQSEKIPAEADVVIIGSGITGCSVAWHLLPEKPDLRVVLLDARTVCSGATGRNGGHIKAVPEASYAELVPIIGKEKAAEVVHFTLANIEELLKVAGSLPSEMKEYHEARRVESLNIFTDEEHYAGLKQRIQDFNNDFPDLRGRMRLVDKDELVKTYGVHNAVGGALSQAGAVWPYRLITGLLLTLIHGYIDKGFSVEMNTAVESINSMDGGYLVQTTRGPIRAKQVVHATNAYAGNLLPGLRGKLFPLRGQMTAQETHSEFGIEGGQRSWAIHYGKGYDYITQSGRGGEIFVGGGLIFSDPLKEIGSTLDDTNALLPAAHLGGIMDATFGRPVRSEIKSTWTGVMGFTIDGLPLVGRVPNEVSGRLGEGEYVAAGYNGYGMPNAWLCGRVVANTILGKESTHPVPSAYVVTNERLAILKPEIAAQKWLAAFERP